MAKKITLLEAILKEQKARGLKTATGINVCEVILKYNIPVLYPETEQLIEAYKLNLKEKENGDN